MLNLLRLAAAAFAAAGAAYHLAALFSARRFYAAPPRSGGSGGRASLLIPVCGVDEGAEENWAAQIDQQHPCYEVLFGIQDEEDPALPLLRQAAAGSSAASIVHCRRQLGVNRQASNLVQLAERAGGDFLVATDSDMRPGRDYLAAVTAPLQDPEVGLVTCGYADPAPASTGAALASLGRAIDFIPSVLLARALYGRLTFALGATLSLRREVLREIGGFEIALNRIGSDYHIGRAVAQAGYRIELVPYLLSNPGGRETVGALFRRELRWARTIRMNHGASYYGYLVASGHVIALLLLLPGSPRWAAALALAAWGCRVAQAGETLRLQRLDRLRRRLYLLPLRDLLSLAVWLISICGSSVEWRGRRLEVRPGGVLADPSGQDGSTA